MSTASFGELAASIVGRRKCPTDSDFPTDPVRSHSYDVDDDRAKPWRPIGNGSAAHGWVFTEALVGLLAEEVAKHRRRGFEGDCRLQWTHLAVFKAILGLLNYRTGELWASYDTIAERASVSRTAAIEAVEALEHHGFLAHVRRSCRVDGAEGQAGPQRAQAPNAYLFDCETRMSADLWGRFWKRVLVNLSRLGERGQRAAGAIIRSFNPAAHTPPRRDLSPLQAAVESFRRSIDAAEANSASP